MQVADQIIDKCAQWIKFPCFPVDKIAAEERWQTKYTFPCAVDVINCTHIKNEKIPLHSDEYINRKVYHSINFQATCNVDEFKRSNALILGNKGYGVAPLLMVPFGNPAQLAYNKLFTGACNN